MVELILNEQLARETFSKAYGGLPAGSDNPVWGNVLELVVRGYTARLEGNKAIFTGPENFSYIPAAWVKRVCGSGANEYQQNLLNWACFLKLPIGMIGNDVPDILTNPYVVDPVTGEATATLKTWAQWGGPHRSTATHAYVELNGGGVMEDGKTIAALMDLGATILSLEETLADLPPETP